MSKLLTRKSLCCKFGGQKFKHLMSSQKSSGKPVLIAYSKPCKSDKTSCKIMTKPLVNWKPFVSKLKPCLIRRTALKKSR
ncbi:hypothetical protein THIOM_004801 [Candidatus Thiomargarita nelsonii]|uniref:Uncharacterized protein n=1 Tax=Candidatus Thiomargarita nelsonii TaxID=1003181 RepID=A0A176RV10_9GAMM|nr:hypothetical protein THIOM_004801 [Candidatus Thiomargarita nelsonii]